VLPLFLVAVLSMWHWSVLRTQADLISTGRVCVAPVDGLVTLPE
jgi:hypothetical protein